MTRLTQPLRDEHRELFVHVHDILSTADALADRPPEELLDRLVEVSTFLQRDLLRHAAAEEAALYPVVARLMGAPKATATMSRDHREIAGLSEQLDRLIRRLRPGRVPAADAQRILYGLHAVVTLHFAKEEEVYLPILDNGLTPREAAQLFADLDAAAREAGTVSELAAAS